MYEVTQGYLDKATAAGRVYSLRVDVGEVVDGAVVDKAQYLGGVGVLSLKIVRGQTTGGFSLGGTVCAQLSATFTNDVDVRVKDRLQVYVRFGSGDDATAWRGLGWFYVDSVKQGLYNKSVTAYDAMLRLEKNYKSKLTYPAKTSDVLNEISDQTGINLSSSLSLINDATIETVPRMDKSKDGEQRYYTRRAILGYIAATNAGEAYIDVDFKINLAMPTETGYTIEAASVISQTIDDTGFTVNGIVWNKSGISYSLNDDFTENTVELTNPLGYTSEEQILHNLETKLVGLSYSSIKLKKQGTGIFQLGDLVNYATLGGTVYTMLVMGIVYDFSNGFFSETLYSLAKSASQQEYTGSQVTDQKEYTSSETAMGGTLTKYEYLTDLSAKCNGVTYTAEKDAGTGLISKISDSNGNSFEPTIAEGLSIANIDWHNAVFMAVAMVKGFGAYEFMPHMSGVNWYYTNEKMSDSLWSNMVNGGTPILLTNATASGGELTLSKGHGILNTGLAGDITIFVIAKNARTLKGFVQYAGMANPGAEDDGYEFTAQSYGTTYGLTCSTGSWDDKNTGEIYPNTKITTITQYHLIVMRRTGNLAEAFFDGVKASSTKAIYGYSPTFVMGGYHRNGEWLGYNDVATKYKFVAISSQAQTDEEIITNSTWLMNKFGVAT